MYAIAFPTIDPVLVEFGPVAIRWYALAYVAGLMLGWRLAMRLAARPDSPLTRDDADAFLAWATLGVLLGGRLGYVLFYRPGYFLENPAEIPQVWTGGMSFHGGLLGVIIACVGFSWRQRIPWLSVADVLCMATPVGLLLGRIANFINAELWGRPTDLPWGVIFPGEMAQYCPQVVGACARHPSQLYEALLEGLILGAVLLWLVFRKGALKRVGTVTGVFFAGYGLARFLVEFVRQPDAQFVSEGNPLGLAFHVGGYGLTMGQVLSLPMFALAAYLVIRARGSTE